MNKPGGDWTLQDSEKLGQAVRIDQDRVMGWVEVGIHYIAQWQIDRKMSWNVMDGWRGTAEPFGRW